MQLYGMLLVIPLGELGNLRCLRSAPVSEGSMSRVGPAIMRSFQTVDSLVRIWWGSPYFLLLHLSVDYVIKECFDMVWPHWLAYASTLMPWSPFNFFWGHFVLFCEVHKPGRYLTIVKFSPCICIHIYACKPRLVHGAYIKKLMLYT